MTADEFVEAIKYDQWHLFHMIPDDIKYQVIELMDECIDKPYTYIFEGSWYKKILRSI